MNKLTVLPHDPELAFAERLANLLDNQFKIGVWGFGLDAIIDLLPIGGDTIILLLSLILVFIAWRRNLPQKDISRMLTNISLAFLIGLIPIIGDIAYLAFKPNIRNLEILQRQRK